MVNILHLCIAWSPCCSYIRYIYVKRHWIESYARDYLVPSTDPHTAMIATMAIVSKVTTIRYIAKQAHLNPRPCNQDIGLTLAIQVFTTYISSERKVCIGCWSYPPYSISETTPCYTYGTVNAKNLIGTVYAALLRADLDGQLKWYRQYIRLHCQFGFNLDQSLWTKRVVYTLLQYAFRWKIRNPSCANTANTAERNFSWIL